MCMYMCVCGVCVWMSCVQVISVLGTAHCSNCSLSKAHTDHQHTRTICSLIHLTVWYSQTQSTSSTMPARDPITVKGKQKRVIHVCTCTGYLPTESGLFSNRGGCAATPATTGPLCGQTWGPIVWAGRPSHCLIALPSDVAYYTSTGACNQH